MNTAMCGSFCAEKSIGIIGTSKPQIENFSMDAEDELTTLLPTKITNPGINQFSFRNDNKVNLLKMVLV
jgi:hypothetical protein